MRDFERDEDCSLRRFVLWDLLKFVKCRYQCLMTALHGSPSKILILHVPSCFLGDPSAIPPILTIPPFTVVPVKCLSFMFVFPW